jgi:hypothetical protein
MEWCPLPETARPYPPTQWVGCENGEDVAWITEWRHWGDLRLRWMVTTPNGTAFGLRQTFDEARRSAEGVWHLYGAPATSGAGSVRSTTATRTPTAVPRRGSR